MAPRRPERVCPQFVLDLRCQRVYVVVAYVQYNFSFSHVLALSICEMLDDTEMPIVLMNCWHIIL